MIGTANPTDRVNNLELKVAGLERLLAIVDREARRATDVTTLPAPEAGHLGYQDSGDNNEGPWWYHGSAWRRAWNMPWGIVDYVEKTADQTSITTVTDVTGLSITWTGVANRRYRITAQVRTNNVLGAAGDTVDMDITDGSNNLAARSTMSYPSASGWATFTVSRVQTGSGSITRKVRAAKTVGGGSISVIASSTAPAFLLVEDIGPNGAPS